MTLNSPSILKNTSEKQCLETLYKYVEASCFSRTKDMLPFSNIFLLLNRIIISSIPHKRTLMLITSTLKMMIGLSSLLAICCLLYLSSASEPEIPQLPVRAVAPDVKADRIELAGFKSSFTPGMFGGSLEMAINEFQGEEVVRQSFCCMPKREWITSNCTLEKMSSKHHCESHSENSRNWPCFIIKSGLLLPPTDRSTSR